MLSKRRAFANLKVHSTYSILESTLSVSRVAELAFKHSQPSVCLTDTNLHGALEFCVSCRRLGVQPVIGFKLLINDQCALFLSEARALIATIIVRTERGYANLLKLISVSTSDTGYRIVTLRQLEMYSEGITLLIGGASGLAWEIYKQFKSEEIISRFEMLRQVMNNKLCFELQRNVFINRQFESMLINYANTNQLLVVATNDTFFESPHDYFLYKIIRGVACARYDGKQAYFKTYSEMLTRFADVLFVLKNSITLCSTCEFYLAPLVTLLPSFLKTRSLEDCALYIRLIASLEYLFYKIGKTNKREYYKRLVKELSVVTRTRYSGYFLIVMDFVAWAKANKVMVGPGRGSSAGSLLAYCAGITNVDPLQHSLLFERFLNPMRASAPDIDVDFCHTQRDKLIKYIQARYKRANVAQVLTFNALQLKGALKDAGKNLQIEFETINALCASLPPKLNAQNSASLLIARCADARISQRVSAKLIDVTFKLMGMLRHIGTHAAGVIITNSPLINFAPIVWNYYDSINVIQYSMVWADAAGLSKFDLLGLKTLTVISGVLETLAINRIEPNIDFKDKKTYEFICKGLLLATFQLESRGINKHIEHMKPSNINDLAALIALYRPGPMSQIRLYSDIKHGRTQRVRVHNKIDKILDSTHGIIIYQEQVMLIAQALSGYSLTEADELRVAMSKKSKPKMLAHADRFLAGARALGFDSKLATTMFETLARFAGYGFNKSHALAYAVLAYITAYLKCNFTLEYYAVCLTAEMNETNNITDLYYEALKLEVEFAQPTVQAPYNEFKVISGVIQFPLSAIKTLPAAAADSIAICNFGKPFASLANFCYKCDRKVMTERVLKTLILSGALDCFNISRTQLLLNLHNIADCIKSKSQLCLNVHSDTELKLSTLYEEYCLLGCYVSEDPTDRFTCNQQNLQLAVVACQTNSMLTLVFRDRVLEVVTNIDYKLNLGQVYACEVSKSRSKLTCGHLHCVSCNA
ncbi:DNA polymerase III subunit alpha [Candidatus Hodgkinia cicadicola]|nr:DNA polymerase III subunit alpha [Candidatus Hodgkinia cicadicola]